MKKVLVTVALSGMLSTAAYGQSVLDKREHIQRERIQQGVKNGELTRPEARRLRLEEARVHAAEARAKRDGVVTPRERLKLNRRLNATNRDIFRQKHDRQSR
jgi:hypothetical protein